MTGQQNAVDGLPKQFVTSLRVLFDILDEDRSGYVRLRDIESRWHEEGVKGLPSGVIDALRKVAPRNGKLSFDNFVTGLKLSLLKTNVSTISSSHSGKESGFSASKKVQEAQHPTTKKETSSMNYANLANYMNIERAPSTIDPKSNYPLHRSQPKMGSQVVTTANTATVRPNNVLQSQNIELRNQIYTRDQLQQASVKHHSKADYQNQVDTERTVNTRYSGQNPRHSDDLTHYRKNDQTRASHNHQRPKSAHIEGQRPRMEAGYVPRTNDLPAGRPERPPPYKKPEGDTRPPALPPKNMQGRIMKELKSWQKEHQTGTHNKLKSTHSDSKLTEPNRLLSSDLYGKQLNENLCHYHYDEKFTFSVFRAKVTNE